MKKRREDTTNIRIFKKTLKRLQAIKRKTGIPIQELVDNFVEVNSNK